MSTQLKPTSDSAPDSMRAAAYVSDDESTTILKRCFADLGLFESEVKRGNIDTATKDLDGSRSPQVLIVDIAGLDLPLEAMHRLSEVCEPGVEVLVVGERNDIALYRSLARLGVAEYIFKPLTYEIVSEILNRVTSGNVQQRAPKLGKLVNVLGVRGGVGASTLASSLAWHLSETVGRRVALVDFDVNFGTCAMLLDALPNHAFYEALETSERIDMLLLERATTKVTERLFLCSAMEPIDSARRITGGGFQTIVSLLRQRFHYVITDLPANRTDLSDRVLFEEGTLVLVSDGGLASAREVARWRQYFGTNQAGRYVLHVHNRQGSVGDLKAPEFASAIGAPPDLVIPIDKKVAASANTGGSGAMTHRTLQRAASALASKLAGHQHDEEKKGLFSWLRRKSKKAS